MPYEEPERRRSGGKPPGLIHSASQLEERQRERAKRDIYFYFFHLGKKSNNQNFDQDEKLFKQKWNNIPGCDFSANELAMILYKCADYIKDPEAQNRDEIIKIIQEGIDFWEEKAKGKITTFNPQDLSLSLWAFATLRLQPSPDFLMAWEKQTRLEMPRFNSQNLSNSLWAFAALGIGPSQNFLEAWKGRARKILYKNNQNPQNQVQHPDVATNLWSLCILDVIGAKTQLLAHELYQKNEPWPTNYDTFSDAHRRQMTYVRLWLGNALPFTLVNETESDSFYERHLKQEFHKCGFVNMQGDYASEFGHTVNLTLRFNELAEGKTASQAKKIHIELDGISHFVTTHDGHEVYDGRTRFQTALMLSRCEETKDVPLLRLDYKIANKISSLPEQQRTQIFKDLAHATATVKNFDTAYHVVQTLEGGFAIAPLDLKCA